MLYRQDEIEHIKQRIRELFRISSELEQAFPGRKFTLDGHLIGSIGEVIAAYHYGLDLLPSSTEQHDATASDGRRVQIKVTQGWHHIALRSEPEHLIVLWINDNTGSALVNKNWTQMDVKVGHDRKFSLPTPSLTGS